jgi:hypothetical protein
MRRRVHTGRRKWWLLAPFLLLLCGLAAIYFFALRQPVLSNWEMPNDVAAYQAERKLKILRDAKSSFKKGFIRLSQTEANSLLEKKRAHRTAGDSEKALPTSAPSSIHSAVLLNADELCLITWHPEPLLLGRTVALQRKFHLENDGKRAQPQLEALRLGSIVVPQKGWAWTQNRYDPGGKILQDNIAWLQEGNATEIVSNELSKFPELRLYSYMPPKFSAK